MKKYINIRISFFFCIITLWSCVLLFRIYPAFTTLKSKQIKSLHTTEFLDKNIDLPARTFRLASTASLSHPYITHPKVIHYIRQFSQQGGVDFISESLERAKPYIPYILSRLEYYNLPYELLYLPVIESGYRLHAVSHAKATGAWQFMFHSALPYGLTINNWRDDRYDVLLATDAALRKIRDEIHKTEDLWLALAAYNGGLTRILRTKRILQERGLKPDFWTMIKEGLLPKETANYVPKFIAVNHLIRTKIKFNSDVLRKDYANKTIVFFNNPGKIDLKILAKAIDVDLHDIRSLNAGLRQDITPPSFDSKSQYLIRIPIQASEKAREFFAPYYNRSRTMKTIPKRRYNTQAKINTIPKAQILPKNYLGQNSSIPRIPEFLDDPLIPAYNQLSKIY